MRVAVTIAGALKPSSPDLRRTKSYCRAARRIRSVYRGRIGDLHQALGRLNGDQPARGEGSGPEASLAPGVVRGAHPTGRAQFTEMVAGAIEGGILRYSRRQKLLRQAARLGVGRFEANLIIAMVQHRYPSGAPEVPRRRRGSGVAMALVVLVQAAILVGAWLLVA